MTTVTGPDGATFNFPDGTSEEEMRAALDKYYTGGPEAAASRRSADRWASDRTGATSKRSAWERAKDNFVDSWNRGWIAEGWREGYKRGAESDLSHRGILPENPAASIGAVVGAWDNIFDDKGADRNAARMIAEERARRSGFDARSEADPFFKADGNIVDKGVHGAAALGGTLGAAALDPVSYITGGESVLARMGIQAFLAGATDVLSQQSGIGAGVQDEYSLKQTLLSGGAGAAFQGVADGIGRLVKAKPKVKDEPVDRLFKEELDAHELVTEPTLSQQNYPRALPAPLKTVEPEPVAAPKEGSIPKPEQTALVDVTAPNTSEGAAKADPWEHVNWGEAGSKERAAAAVNHLDSLKKLIKPEQVQAFVRWLGKEKVGATEANHWNEEFFDFEKLRSDPEQFIELHNALSDIFKPVYDEAGDAAQTWAKTRDRIDMFGISMADAIKAHSDITGEFGAAHKIHALETIAMQHTDNLYQSMRKLQADVEKGDLSGVGAFAENVQMTALFDAMAAGAKSEIGRALNIMKMAKKRAKLMNDINGQMAALHEALGGKGATPDAEKLKEVLGKFAKAYQSKGAAGLKDEIRKARTMGFWDYFGYAATGNLLANPATFLRNTIGTGLHAVIQVGERYVGASVGAARNVSPWRTAERVTFREANAYAAAIASALHDGLTAGARGFKHSISMSDGASSVEATNAIPFAITPERRAKWRSDPLRSLPDMVGAGYFSLIRNLAYRPMVAADEFYKTVARRMQIAALATREAAYRSARVGGKESEKVFKDTIAAIASDPTDAAMKRAAEFFDNNTIYDPSQVQIGAYRPDPSASPEQRNLEINAEEAALILKSIDIQRMAEDHARMVAFQNGGPQIAALTKALSMVPIIKYLYVPFLKTPLLLTKAGLIDRNPVLAPFTKEGKSAFKHLMAAQSDIDARLGRGGGEADLVMARMVTGGGFLMGAWMMAANGLLVGDRNPVERQDGIPPNSLKIGDTWVQISPLSPLAEPLMLVANLHKTITEHRPDDDLAEALFGGVFAALTNAFIQKGPLAGLEDLTELFFGRAGMDDDARAKVVGKQASEKLIAALFPASAATKALTQIVDPAMRDANSLLDRVKQTVPTWSDQLPQRRDFLGRPIIRKPGELAIMPYKFAKETQDVMDQEFSRLAKMDPDLDIRPPSGRFNGQPVEPEERWRIAEIQGQLWRNPATGLNMEEAVRQLMFSDEYSYWPDAQRANALKELMSWYRSGASWAIRNPNSEFYMPDMVRRTGTEKLESEAAKHGWDASVAAARGRRYGLTQEDADAWSAILNDEPADQ